jgi:hypothetical protein
MAQSAFWLQGGLFLLTIIYRSFLSQEWLLAKTTELGGELPLNAGFSEHSFEVLVQNAELRFSYHLGHRFVGESGLFLCVIPLRRLTDSAFEVNLARFRSAAFRRQSFPFFDLRLIQKARERKV